MMKPLDQFEVWFVTGSQDLYGAAALDRSPSTPVRSRRRSTRAAADPRPGRAQAGRDEPPSRSASSASRRTPPTAASGVIAWMHTFSPAKMWIAGLGRAAEAAAPPAHAVQPRPAVGRDRHGLHEPEPVGARRPGVRLRRDADAARAEDGRRPLARPGRRRADRHLDARGLRLARGAVAARRPLRRQHARGRGHRGRQGRGADPARLLGERLRRRRSRRCGRATCPTTRGRCARRRVRGRVRARAGAARRAASGASRCATRRGSRPGCAAFLDAGGFGRSRTRSRISTASRSCPGSPSSG